MKNIFKIGAIALTTVLVLGCAKEMELSKDGDTDSKLAQYDNPTIFSGSLGVAPQTRTSLGQADQNRIPVLWSAGDNIGVYTYTNGAIAYNAKAAISEGAGSGIGKFVTNDVDMAQSGNVFYLYYPYTDGAVQGGDPTEQSPVRYFANGGEPYIKAIIPAVQLQSGVDNFDNFGRYGYSVAKSDPADKGAEISFEMKQLMSFLQLSFWSTDPVLAGFTVEEIAITAPAGETISGIFKGDFNGVVESVAGSNKITLQVSGNAPVTTNAAAPQKFLATMIPSDLSGKSLTIEVKVKELDGTRTRIYTSSFGGANFSAGKSETASSDFSKWRVATAASAELDVLVANIAELDALAVTFSANNAQSTGNFFKYKDWLVAMYLRQLNSGYTTGNWPTVAGVVNTDFVNYIKAQKPLVDKYFRETPTLKASEEGYVMEVYHMGAALSAILHKSIIFEQVFDDLSGWAGDFQTFLRYDIYNKTATNQTADFYKAEALKHMGKDYTTYSMSDLISDVDAVNFGTMIKTNGMSISDAFRMYYGYQSGYLKRYTLFAGTDYNKFFTRVEKYAKNSTSNVLLNGITVTANHTNGIGHGYCEYVFRLIEQETATKILP